MKTKLVLKLLVLIFGLLIVVVIRSQLGTGSFTGAVNSLFGVTDELRFTWCADHVVDVVWVSSEVPEKLKKLDMADLRNKYCTLKTEAIQGIDLDKVNWQPLAESNGAAGKKTLLEWNKDLGLFRSGGMPFKSSLLSRELVDK